MQPIPYLFFDGNCREAMETYGRIFGGSPDIMPFAAMPEEDKAQMPGVPEDAVMHASLKIGDGMVYASDDTMPDRTVMTGSYVTLELDGADETRRVWDALADGGEVEMNLAPQFWTPLFGTVRDRFGTRWMLMQQSDFQG